ncbi:hypothetical protein [Salmonella enterica]|uniref:hypothetical protein n=1 Tax=Salmonella enterica TaxID=28901 RepID=UPI00071AE391|nr:hypothetical protein [Salmonella enterica]KSB23075.1 hypothetical protein LFZ18_05730 [Salmonella enterica subsp. enterica serovar Itami str. SA20014991]MDJ8539461.1 hypothetical protein [Salmonella enterica]HBK1056426.1 hypothetical protein [Salmonella enterica]
MPQLNTNSARYFKPDHSPDAAARRFYKYRNILIAPYFKLAPDATVGLNDPGPNSVQC